jgi:hypothetical protein
MAELLTSEINGEKITLGKESGELRLYDGLTTPISEDIIILTEVHKRQIEAYAKKAASEYGDAEGQPEPTFAHAEHGVPALVVRIDCTISDGKIIPYEMEDSPSGQGITDTIHRNTAGEGIKPTILGHYEELAGEIPHVIVSGSRSHGTDDKLVVGEENYTFGARPAGLKEDQPVIVKAIPGDPSSHSSYVDMQARALAPLATEGDKSYAERIGDLNPVASEADLLTGATGELLSQVVKARMGSMAMGVSIYLDPGTRKLFGKKGAVTAAKLKANLEAYAARGGALAQEFIAPIQSENPEGRANTILRVFALLSKDKANGEIEAKVIGGCYVARPELIVHGASNSVAGAVVVN